MQPGYDRLHLGLNAPTAKERLASLRKLVAAGEVFPPAAEDTNNHIHTTFSFSPYSPAAAVYMARKAGLATAGIMDHDTIAGAREFLEAAEICGIAGTIGLECRVSFAGTPFETRRINNPDQSGCVYMTLHAVPHTQIDRVQAFFEPLRRHRANRNRRMVAALNAEMAAHDISLDYELGVEPLSEWKHGGTVTERHIAAALAGAIIAKAGTGKGLVSFLKVQMGLPISEKAEGLLSDENNAFLMYDLLGLIKSDLISRFYIDAKEECLPVAQVLAFGLSVGAIPAYAYLGDVGDSVTGDKRVQAFEDAYIEELFAYLKQLGFPAITYMPSRNTTAQLQRVQQLCQAHGFMQISGEDINQPRQPFVCYAARQPMFSHLQQSAWELIRHERETV